MTKLTKNLVLASFVCPICAATNQAHLISVSQAGGTACSACRKWLTSQDIMRARISPRPAQTTTAPPSPPRA